ncbi:hypothetical protein MKK67_29135, partial [Methylobacterium sp. J-072]|uniref:hypothetical protein n=1 Tax=Methylobacterium sp. J-072 TaxID=2836651 RepID=UPI001FBBBE69
MASLTSVGTDALKSSQAFQGSNWNPLKTPIVSIHSSSLESALSRNSAIHSLAFSLPAAAATGSTVCVSACNFGSSALSVLASLRTAKLYGSISGGMEDALAQKIELRAAVHAPL